MVTAYSNSYRCGQSIRAIVADLSGLPEEELTLDQADLLRIEVVYHELVAMDGLGVLGEDGPAVEAMQYLARAHVSMGKVVEQLQVRDRGNGAVQAPVILTG